MPPEPLPTHRELLTALTEALATSTRGLPAPAPTGPQSSSNPLRGLGSETRHIISTLHVLFPSLLLPALDLLDRDLVRRVVVVAASAPLRDRNDDDDDDDDGSSTNDDSTVEKDVEQAREGTYLVRSLVSTMGGKRRAQAKSYLVLLTAWSCTCPAFIFDALPARTTSTPSSNAPPSAHPFRSSSAAPATAEPSSDPADGAPQGEPAKWSFGGLSRDGLPGRGGRVPCCKHLLACVLVERWGDVLGKYAPELRVTREGMAGLVTDL